MSFQLLFRHQRIQATELFILFSTNFFLILKINICSSLFKMRFSTFFFLLLVTCCTLYAAAEEVKGVFRKECHVWKNALNYQDSTLEGCGSGRCWSVVTHTGLYKGGCNSWARGCSTEFWANQGFINGASKKCCDESFCNIIDEKYRRKVDSDAALGDKTPKPPSSPFDGASSVRTLCVAVYLTVLAFYCALIL